MTDANIGYIWGFLAECHRRGWLYRGHRLMPWCHRCGTSLSQHELADSYAELTHPLCVPAAATRRRDGRGARRVDHDAVDAARQRRGGRQPRRAVALVRTSAGDVWVAEAGPATCRSPAKPSGRGPGPTWLAGPTTRPCRTCRSSAPPRTAWWPGTGCPWRRGPGMVHIAPGCGAEDFDLGRALGLPTLAPIDEDGRYTGGSAGCPAATSPAWTRRSPAGSPRRIPAAPGTVRHRYPRCWRCATPLVHPRGGRVVPGLRRDQGAHAGRGRGRRLASRALRPAHGRLARPHGRLVHHRKRYWGLPLPFYLCPAGHLTVVASGRICWPGRCRGRPAPELHRPWIDAVQLTCETCGAAAARVPEVGDCWLDAGIVAFSTLGWRNPQTSPGVTPQARVRASPWPISPITPTGSGGSRPRSSAR